MPHVDFYVLSESGPDGRLRQACHLAEQAAEREQRVFLLTLPGETQRLDDLLWTFHDRAFLPHEVAGPGAPSHAKVFVLVGSESVPENHRELVINLTEAVPPDAGAFAKIAEIVDTDAERKRSARERFKQYRELGCELETHNL
jgi:DNA polymerase III subunit chi